MLNTEQMNYYKKIYVDLFGSQDNEAQCERLDLASPSHLTRTYIMGKRSENLDERSTFPPEIRDLVLQSNQEISKYLLEYFSQDLIEIYQPLLERSSSQLDQLIVFMESICQAWEKLIDRVADSENGLKILIGFQFAWVASGKFGMLVATGHLKKMLINGTLTPTLPARDFMRTYGALSTAGEKQDSFTSCPIQSTSNVFLGLSHKLIADIQIPQLSSEKDLDHSEIATRLEIHLKKILKARGFLN